MKRVVSQYIQCSYDCILQQTIIESTDNDVITRIFPLADCTVEPANTLFYDGVISARPMSLKCRHTDIGSYLPNYQLVHFSRLFPIQKQADKRLLIDFETDDLAVINARLPEILSSLSGFAIREIIDACTYTPAALAGENLDLLPEKQAPLVLWQNVSPTDSKLSQVRLKEI